MENPNKDDFCGNCGHKGADTWVVDNKENDPYFYANDCECEEHVQCKNCGVPL